MFRLSTRMILVIALTISAGNAWGEVLYTSSNGTLYDGLYGPIVTAQSAINKALEDCGSALQVKVDGRFGQPTQAALKALARCLNWKTKLAADAEARAGALTTTYWDSLLHSPSPDVDTRARTLMLTYEATDYTAMEWNFCQSKPLYDPKHGQPICYSNDPHSYVTWGPNGATGGGGREVQIILSAVDKQNTALIDESFGDEKEALRRMFRVPDRDAGRSLETFLCGIWADAGRRRLWRTGFEKIGREASVRDKFDEIYRSLSLDGGKIEVFEKAYASNGLTTTEIDYAFFKDRAAHTSPSSSLIRAAVKGALDTDRKAAHWHIRRAIALNVRPGTQRKDRLGRDVAFYIDGSGFDALTQEEKDAWKIRGTIRASDAGMSDDRVYTHFKAGPPIDTRIADPVSLTRAEIGSCPSPVLGTRFPKRP